MKFCLIFENHKISIDFNESVVFGIAIGGKFNLLNYELLLEISNFQLHLYLKISLEFRSIISPPKHRQVIPAPFPAGFFKSDQV